MNNTTTHFKLPLFLLLFYWTTHTSAQINAGGTPFSFSEAFEVLQPQRNVAIKTIPKLNLDQLQAADKAKQDMVRFAAPTDVSISLQDGAWIELPNGDHIWQMQLEAEGALGIFLAYQDFYLPFGARFFMYSGDRKEVLGAYTHKNNRASGTFFTGMISGETAIIELYEPAHAVGQSRIHINRVYQAYHQDHIEPSDYPFQIHMAGFGDALPCHININCPEGDDWQTHKKGVVRMLRVFEEGVGWCSGTLINNTNEDGKPYVLSAFHCIAGYTPMLEFWRFDFNYESPNCSTPMDSPQYQSILGCTNVAGREESDFLLVELSQSIPSTYNPYFVGWNRSSAAIPDTTTGIHHPQGDIRKISQDYDPATIYAQSIPWNNNVTTPANHHFRVEFDAGTFENGSSGSALLNEDGQIVGQLHGGLSNCAQFIAFYGRFSISWDAGPDSTSRLMEWLDPTGTGVMQLGAYEPPPAALISGTVRSMTGQPIANASVYLSGSWQDSLVTDASGTFSFEVPRGGSYTLTAKKSSEPRNGVSAFDIILIQKHILSIDPLTDPNQILAADVNASGTITGFDIVQIRKVLLFIDDNFMNDESWRFEQSSIPVQNVNGDINGLEFTGYKVGDVNGNADPGM